MLVKHSDKENKIGGWTNTTIVHETCAGYFEIGTLVKIIGKSERGYDIEDEFGNRMIEIGWVI